MDIEVRIRGLMMDPATNMPIVVLKDVGSDTVMPIWVGIFDGATGVFIFFVISGYLITSLLLNEHEERGSISLRSFYFRRAMRILPPLYVYVGFLLLLGLAGRLPIVRLALSRGPLVEPVATFVLAFTSSH